MVEVVGLKPTASWSRTMRAINCATPRNKIKCVNDFSTRVSKKSSVREDKEKKVEKIK